MNWQVCGEHPSLGIPWAQERLLSLHCIYLILLLGRSFTSPRSRCRGAFSSVNQQACGTAPLWHLYYSGWTSNVGKSLIIKCGHKHLMVCHEYFRSLNIIQKWPLESRNFNEAHLRQITSAAGATRGPFSGSFGFFVAWLDWFVICNRRSLATGLWIIQFIALPFITNFCGFWVHCHIDSLIACLAGS